MFQLFKRDKKVEAPKTVKKKKAQRSFIGARFTRMNNFNESYSRINQDIETDYIALSLRAKSLYENNQIVASYINLMIRSVLGANGFHLNVTSYNQDGNSDLIANQIIEDAWNDYNKSIKKYVSADHQMNGLDFDRHVLFNYLLFGQVFIRKVKDSKSKYGIRFELIDNLDVDTLYNTYSQYDNHQIVMGIQIDQHYRPLYYYIRKNKNANWYNVTERDKVSADEIIHVYRKLYPNQVRGFTPLSSILLTLNSLQEYKRAQISAAILNSCFMGIWEQKGSGDSAIDQYDEEEVDDNGDIVTELESNVFRFAPKNHTLKEITSQHPNSNIKQFFKSMLKGVCGALGISYNKIASDVSETSYSSLRQANIEDAATVRQLQQFLIENWKDIEYAEFLKYLLLSDLTNLPYSKIDKFMEHSFQGNQAEYLDPQKEIAAIQLRLSLGLSSPIEQIHNLGKDPYDVLDSWAKWNAMLKDRGLKLSETMPMISNVNEQKIEQEV